MKYLSHCPRLHIGQNYVSYCHSFAKNYTVARQIQWLNNFENTNPLFELWYRTFDLSCCLVLERKEISSISQNMARNKIISRCCLNWLEQDPLWIYYRHQAFYLLFKENISSSRRFQHSHLSQIALSYGVGYNNKSIDTNFDRRFYSRTWSLYYKNNAEILYYHDSTALQNSILPWQYCSAK